VLSFFSIRTCLSLTFSVSAFLSCGVCFSDYTYYQYEYVASLRLGRATVMDISLSLHIALLEFGYGCGDSLDEDRYSLLNNCIHP